jgi:hypothetical protein
MVRASRQARREGRLAGFDERPYELEMLLKGMAGERRAARGE